MSKSLRNACIGEFIGTGFILFGYPDLAVDLR